MMKQWTGFRIAVAACALLMTGGSITFSHAQSGLAAYYPLDGTAADASGNGNTGVIRGFPVPEAGVERGALRFDGVDDGITVADSPDFTSSTFSIGLWVRIDADPVAPQEILSKDSGGTGYTLTVTPQGRISFEVRSGGVGEVASSPFSIHPGKWTPLFANYDGNNVSLYVEGSLAASTPLVGIDPSTSAPLLIARGFAGTLDEIRISTMAASPSLPCSMAGGIWAPPADACLPRFEEEAVGLRVDDLTGIAFGVTLVDINDDGWLDLYYVNGGEEPNIVKPPSGTCPDLDNVPFTPGSANTLFLNRGNGTFTRDLAPQMGIADEWVAMGHSWGDIDNDGLREVFSHNWMVSNLYKPIVGPLPLIFENWNDEAGIHVCQTKGTGMAFVDFDNDGFLDIMAVEYDPERLAVDHVNQAFMNNGDGTFTEFSADSGIADPSEPNNPMGISFADYDNDGDQDVYFTNSHEVPSRLYRNDGIGPAGTPVFVDVAAAAGVQVMGNPSPLVGVSAAWGDYNNDGFMDLIFGRATDSRLFRNDGPNGLGVWTFTDVTGLNGLNLTNLTGWDTNFADLNNDGWLDILTVEFRAGRPNRVFLNQGGESFVDVAQFLQMQNTDLSQRGVVVGDIDNDGDLDVVFVSADLDGVGRPNTLHRNHLATNNWIQFRLQGTFSNRDAVGARIAVRAQLQPGGPLVTQIREITAGTGFFTDFPRIQTFGLGKAAIVQEVLIRWPSGIVQNLGSMEINRRYDVLEF